MSDLKRQFSSLILTSALAGSGAAMAQSEGLTKEAQHPKNSAEQCFSLDSKSTDDADKRMKACLYQASIVDALKSGDIKAVNAALVEGMKTNTPKPVAASIPSP